MTEKAKHIVNTVVFDIATNNSKQAVELQEEASFFANNELPNLLDTVFFEFDDYYTSNRHDKIEIDLGVIGRKDFLPQCNEKILEQLRSKLTKPRQNIEPGKVEETSANYSQKEVQILIYFLKYGTLPWYCESEVTNVEEIFSRLIELQNVRLFDFIKQNLNNPVVRKRILFQFKKTDIINLITAIYKKQFNGVIMLLENIVQLNTYTPIFEQTPTVFIFRIYDAFLQVVAEMPTIPGISDEEIFLSQLANCMEISYLKFLKKVRAAIRSNNNQGFNSLEPFENTITTLYKKEKRISEKVKYLSLKIENVRKTEDFFDTEIEDTLKEQLLESNEKKSSLNKKKLSETDEDFMVKEPSKIYDLRESDNQFLTDLKKIKHKQKLLQIIQQKQNIQPKNYFNEESNSEIGYTILNAGLVLLQPFIPELFKKLGILKNGKFIGENAHHKAVGILQYLVNPKSKPFEDVLILNKILCGIPISEPVKFELQLMPHEKAACTKMVKAAIKHWSVLKNTSAKGFRESFLQRYGLLKFSDEKWILRIQRNGFDILLNSIPWQYNMIKYSWMENILETEW